MVLSLLVAALAVAGGTEEESASTTATMSTGKYNEAPMLAELVAAGELPPVDERLPDEPKVKEVVEEIGQYGGTINAFAINMDSWNDMGEVIGGSSFLLDITADNEIVPDLAAGYELAPGGKSMTLSLRPGAKWSDGHPFTADDIVFMFEDMENYSLYKENEQSGGYRVIAVPGVNASEAAFSINQNYPDAALREIFNDVRFRRALSTALDREEINETVYSGLGTPRQATTLANASFYKPEWGEAHPYLAYDPDTANELLDDMGLTARDADGFRLVPGGDTLVLLLEYPESFPDPTMFDDEGVLGGRGAQDPGQGEWHGRCSASGPPLSTT